MDCNGLKHLLITDTDGSFIGNGDDRGVILASSEWFNQGARNTPPFTFRSDRLGRPLALSEVMPNGFGVVRPNCVKIAAWNAWRCGEKSLSYRMLVMMVSWC